MRRCRGCSERQDTNGQPLATHPDCPRHGNLVTVEPVTLDKATAARLQRAAKLIDEATADRNHWILEAHGFGASLREIAEHAGITHVAVLKIIRKSNS